MTERAGQQTTRRESSPLALALLNNRFEGVARAMMNTLLRTARSAILNTARDFSCCILTADDQLLAMAESLPIHVMSGPDLIARYMKEVHPVLEARGRVPPQLPLPRQLTRRGLVRRDPGDRRHRGAPLHRARKGPPRRLRQLGANHVCRRRHRRLQRRRPDLPLRESAGGLPGSRRHHPHGQDADPRPRPVVRRLPRAARRSPDRRAATARARARGGQGLTRRLRARLVRLQRGANDRSDPTDAGRHSHPGRTPRPCPGHAGRRPGQGRRHRRPVRRADRGRPPRQPRLSAVRPQPHRGDRTDRRDDGRLHRTRHRRAAQRRDVPPADGAPSRELRRRDPEAPLQLLRRDHRPVGAHRRPCRTRPRRPRRGVRVGTDRTRPTGLDVRHLGNRPAPRRRAVRQPAHPRGHRRRRLTERGRLAHDPRHRCRRIPVPGQRRDRRDEVPDHRSRAAHRPRQRGCGPPPRLPRSTRRVRAHRRMQPRRRLPQRRHLQRIRRSARRTPRRPAPRSRSCPPTARSPTSSARTHRFDCCRESDSSATHVAEVATAPRTSATPSASQRTSGRRWISADRALTVYGVALSADGEVDQERTEARRAELATEARPS